MRALAFVGLLVVLLASGCAQLQPSAPPTLAAEAPLAKIAVPTPRRGQGGGVFSTESPWNLLSDSRAFRPGDVLTVTLEETTQASKKADTSFGKNSSATISPMVVGGKSWKSDIGLSAERSFDGTSSSSQQNTLQGAITVIVHEVLPNGLLRVSGEKTLYLNQGEEFLRLAGYVRAADIDTDNRVSSLRVADARIVYSGKGTLADANSAGWLTRFFNSPMMPF